MVGIKHSTILAFDHRSGVGNHPGWHLPSRHDKTNSSNCYHKIGFGIEIIPSAPRPKPPYGSPCNSCGLCCLNVLSLLDGTSSSRMPPLLRLLWGPDRSARDRVADPAPFEPYTTRDQSGPEDLALVRVNGQSPIPPPFSVLERRSPCWRDRVLATPRSSMTPRTISRPWASWCRSWASPATSADVPDRRSRAWI